MSFFNIMPRSKSYQDMTLEAIPLRVVRDDGIKYEPAIKFKEIELAGGNSIYRNNTRYNDSFDITIVLNKDDTFRISGPGYDMPTLVDNDTGTVLSSVHYDDYRDENVISVLDYWIRSGEPFYVITDAVGIPADELWLVTEQKTRKQHYENGYVEWDLTFTRYKEITLGNFHKTTDVITNALKKLEAKNKDKNTDSKTKLKEQMKKCKHTVLKFEKKKKVLGCVKTMQEILFNEGCYPKNSKKKDVVDGWYGKSTREAVKKYKTKYKKTYGLKVYGNSVDYKTWQVMCGTAKKVSNKSAGISQQHIVKNATSKDKVYGSVVNVNVASKNAKNATVTVKSTSVTSQGKSLGTISTKNKVTVKTTSNKSKTKTSTNKSNKNKNKKGK